MQLSAALQVQPQAAPIHNSLGLSLAKAGRDDDAIPHYTRAIALQPNFIDAYLNLAMVHSRAGRNGEAVDLVMRSIAVRETPENKTQFTRLVSGIAIDRDDPQLRRLLTRALAEGWGMPSEIAPACMALVRHGPASTLIARAVAAWPARLPAAELLGPAGLAVLSDPLLHGPMDSAVLYDADIEKFLAACRAALLEAAEATPPGDADDNLLGIAAALARQCFINEYVYAASDDEDARAQRLRVRVDAALAANEPASPLWVAVVAAYVPLHELSGAQSLLARSWPASMTSLLDQQIRAPREEAALRANIRQLTPIGDGVSQAVQAQYEANPYPRWIRTPKPRRYAAIDAYLRELLPAATFRPLGKSGSLDILIAGCGTGQHALVTGQQYEGGRTLAIDLSRASLAYAAAKTRELGIEGIEYAHADIMRLGDTEAALRPDRVGRRAASYGRPLGGLARAALAAAAGRLHAHRALQRGRALGRRRGAQRDCAGGLRLDPRRHPPLPHGADAAR